MGVVTSPLSVVTFFETKVSFHQLDLIFHNNISRSRITVSFFSSSESFSKRLHLHESSPVIIKSAISDLWSNRCKLYFHFDLSGLFEDLTQAVGLQYHRT